MDYFTKEGDLRLPEVAGRISQAAFDAAYREMCRIIEKEGFDPAYWSFDLAVKLKELAPHDFTLLREANVFIPGYEEQETCGGCDSGIPE